MAKAKASNGAATPDELGGPVTAEEIIAAVETPAETVAEVVAEEKKEVVAEVEAPAEVVAEPVAEVQELKSEIVLPELDESELSLVEQFKKQAALDELAPAEVVELKTGLSTKEEILEHLQFQDQSMWTNVTPLLIDLAKKSSVVSIQRALDELASEGKIKLNSDAHRQYGTPFGSDKDHKTLYHSIETLNVYVKLS